MSATTDLHIALTKQGVESMAVIITGMEHAFDTYAEEGEMVDGLPSASPAALCHPNGVLICG